MLRCGLCMGGGEGSVWSEASAACTRILVSFAPEKPKVLCVRKRKRATPRICICGLGHEAESVVLDTDWLGEAAGEAP